MAGLGHGKGRGQPLCSTSNSLSGQHSVARWLSPSVAWAVLPHAPSLAGMLTSAPPPLDEGSIRACCNLTSPEVALVLD